MLQPVSLCALSRSFLASSKHHHHHRHHQSTSPQPTKGWRATSSEKKAANSRVLTELLMKSIRARWREQAPPMGNSRCSKAIKTPAVSSPDRPGRTAGTPGNRTQSIHFGRHRSQGSTIRGLPDGPVKSYLGLRTVIWHKHGMPQYCDRRNSTFMIHL